ncbi:MFS transporter [Actinomadura sp. 9N215]|uniref:MFS transporter n=1 Tax=Actinomadura sp. 9N215 TaxID=3375150 RepID=UPI0037B1DCA4
MLTVYLVAFIALLDVNIVIIALPSMQTALGASNGTLLWVVTSYTLCLSALALSAGALGDRYGRKRAFLTGVALFTLGSAVCAASLTPALLIAGRFLQGAGAAIALPGSLSLIAQAFPDPARRARVIGGWSTVGGASSLAGPVIGGILVETFGWPSIFLINLPLGVLALLTGWRCIPESADPRHAALDPAGQILGVLWLGALSYGLINAGEHGWDTPATITALGVAAGGLVAFLTVELRGTHPMLPIRLFTDLRFVSPNLAAFAVGFCVFSLSVFLPTYLQQAQHRSAAEVGVLMLAPALVPVLVPPLAGRWIAKAGPRVPLATGFVLVAAGTFTLPAVQPDTGYLLIAAVLALMGAGYGMTMPASNSAVMAAVRPQHTGIAAATINATRQTGTSLGIALLGALLAAQAAHPGARSAEQAHTDGLHLVGGVAGIVALATALFTAAAMRPAGTSPTTSTTPHRR